MKRLNQFVDWLVRAFGGGKFIAVYNAATLIWYFEGRYNPHWFDPFPSNFYTFVVSWLAINMTSFVLRSDLRSRIHEERRQKKDEDMTVAILHLSESNQQILKYLVKTETGVDLDEDVSE